MSATEIPPPGPERDAELARLLGDDVEERAEHEGVHIIEDSENPHAGPMCDRCHATCCEMCGESLPATCKPRPRAYSTDPAACDRLVEEMMRRGWVTQHVAHIAGDHSALCLDVEKGAPDTLTPEEHARVTHGATRPDAVSAAALLALRGER